MNKAELSRPPQSFLQSRRYLFYWISSLLSNMGTWMQQVAQPWVILSINPSSFWIGLDSFAMNVPQWLFVLLGGVWADRFDRKKIVLGCQFLQMLAVAALLVLIVLGHIQIWMILVCSFIIGTTDSLSMPELQSLADRWHPLGWAKGKQI